MVRQFTEAEVRRWRPAALVIFSLTLAVLGHSGWLRGQTNDGAASSPEKPLTAPALSLPADSQPAATPAVSAKPAPPSLPEASPAAPAKKQDTEKSQPAEESPAARPAPAPAAPALPGEAAESPESSEAETAPAPREDGESLPSSTIVITPRQKYPPHAPYAVAVSPAGHVASAAGLEPACSCEVPGSCPQCRPQIRAADYRRAYEAIPFSRAEYEANPSYRHEAAMELLFGQLRPTTIHRVQPAVPPRSAALSSAPQLLQPAPFRHYRFGYYRRGYGVYYRWPSWQLR
ncbi:MAG: hypothetical protein KDA79_00960 [Planctomycetaceae bacterium]|nr:hypothetical protein [Planctomycetaceae bacterium]